MKALELFSDHITLYTEYRITSHRTNQQLQQKKSKTQTERLSTVALKMLGRMLAQ